MRNWICVMRARICAKALGLRTFWADYGHPDYRVFVVAMHTHYELYHTFGTHEQPETIVDLSHKGLRKQIAR